MPKHEKEPQSKEEEKKTRGDKAVESEEDKEYEKLAEIGFSADDIRRILQKREEIEEEIERLSNEPMLSSADMVLKELAIKIAAYQGIDIKKEISPYVLGLSLATDEDWE